MELYKRRGGMCGDEACGGETRRSEVCRDKACGMAGPTGAIAFEVNW